MRGSVLAASLLAALLLAAVPAAAQTTEQGPGAASSEIGRLLLSIRASDGRALPDVPVFVVGDDGPREAQRRWIQPLGSGLTPDEYEIQIALVFDEADALLAETGRRPTVESILRGAYVAPRRIDESVGALCDELGLDILCAEAVVPTWKTTGVGLQLYDTCEILLSGEAGFVTAVDLSADFSAFGPSEAELERVRAMMMEAMEEEEDSGTRRETATLRADPSPWSTYSDADWEEALAAAGCGPSGIPSAYSVSGTFGYNTDVGATSLGIRARATVPVGSPVELLASGGVEVHPGSEPTTLWVAGANLGTPVHRLGLLGGRATVALGAGPRYYRFARGELGVGATASLLGELGALGYGLDLGLDRVFGSTVPVLRAGVGVGLGGRR